MLRSLLVISALLSAGLAVAEETEDQKTLYALGIEVGNSLAPFDLTPAELEIVKTGLTDAIAGKARADLAVYKMKIGALAQSRAGRVAEKTAKAALAYVEQMKAAPGAQVQASGLIFIPETAGTGESPKATDKVTVHYEGTLPSGEVFDSSYKRGAPMSFQLNRVIKCWTEGVQLMKKGGKATLICPAGIAYGDRGAPPKIKPGATLKFVIELISIGE